MRPAVMTFATDVARALSLPGPVLQIGARVTEGEDDLFEPRELFTARPYLGLDIRPGAGVDCLGDAHGLPLPDASIGTALAFETLEHVADPHRVVHELHRVLRPGGVAVISSVMFFPIHAHPWDYWRFTPEGFELLLQPFESRMVVSHGWQLMPEGVFGIGVKGPCADLTLDALPGTAGLVRSWGKAGSVDFGPIRMSVRELWRVTLRETRRSLTGRARRVLAGRTR